MTINNRLKEIANLIDNNDSILDVGCDHSLLGIYLYQTKENIKVISSDINPNPLKQAKKMIEKYHLEEKIKIKLGCGISTIEEHVNTVVISGMGGYRIIDILKEGNHLLNNVYNIIVSPNNNLYEVRKEITQLGYYIEDEKLVQVASIIYNIIKFKKGYKKYSYIEYLYGPILIKNKNTLFLEYITKEIKTKEKILKVISSNKEKDKLKKDISILRGLID